MQGQVFVDREREVEELKGYLDKALSGQGQVCFIAGQAGSGKTALVGHFVQQALAPNPDLVVAMASCNAQTGIGDPYLPFREALAMLTGDPSVQHAARSIAPENVNRLRAGVVRSVQVLVEVAPELVGVLVPGAKLLSAVGKAVADKVGWTDKLELLAKKPAAPTAEQSRIFEQYTAYLQRLSIKTPLILFVDDLQWADSASLGLLFHLGRRIGESHILMVGAYRPEDVALGRGGERHPLEPVVHEMTRYYGDVSVDLDAIPETANRQFVDNLVDGESNRLGEAFREALFHRTGGHALFTVELIQAMRERGDLIRDGEGRWVEGLSLDWNALPARVEGVIAERIARLDGALREMLTVGSVEGEEFSAEVVARVQAMVDGKAIRRLSSELEKEHRLVSALGLVQFGRLVLALYRFAHNLFQQYLYGSLGEAERAYLHRDVGQVLEELFDGQTEEVAAQLARHFEEARIPAKAAAYRLQAGNKAHRMSASQVATTHLTRGLELVASLSPGPERMQLELGLQGALGTTLIATHGYGSPQVERAFVRARELCRALGDPPQVIPVLYGLFLFRLVRAELVKAEEEGEQLLLLAERAGDVGYILGCHAGLGVVAMYLGRFEDARQHLEQAITLYDPSQHRDLAYQQGQDPGVTALSYLSWVLWFQGYPEQAIARQKMALELAKDVNHPYSLGLATVYAAILYELMRRWPECQAQAEEASQLANQGQFSLWRAASGMLHGVAVAFQGLVEEGLVEISQGLVGFGATGTQLSLPKYRAELAEVYLLAGRQEDGLNALEESLSSGEHAWWLPEQDRIRAELLLLEPGNEAKAEASLRQALDLARSQKSKSLELRAPTSLARLLQEQGRTAEARELLAECYAWFTEGFDTPDLQEAEELLKELAQ